MILLRSPRALLGVALMALVAACDAPTPPSNTSTINLSRPATNPVYPGANGSARFERSGNDRELEIAVADIPAGAVVVFNLHGNRLGTRTASADGRASINVSSESGGSLPFEVQGFTVTVTTDEGVLVVSGTF